MQARSAVMIRLLHSNCRLLVYRPATQTCSPEFAGLITIIGSLAASFSLSSNAERILLSMRASSDARRSAGPLLWVGIAVLLVAAWFVRRGLLLIYVSIVFAIVFSPAVNWIQRRRIRGWSPGRGFALLILVAIVLVVIAAFAVLAIPPIVHDSQQLASQTPDNLHQLADKVRRLPIGDKIAAQMNGDAVRRAATAIAGTALKAFQSVTGAVTGLFTLILLTAYFILDGRRAFQWALELLSDKARPRARDTSERAAHRVQKWLSGQGLLMLILGGSSTIVFGLLGIRYFYALGVFAGLANFVPVLGPIATVIVAGLVAAIDSWMKVLGVVIFYLVYQQVENAYLTPHIMRSTVGLPGVAVLGALVIGSELAGVVGAVVAVPSAALISTFIDEYAANRREQPAIQDRAA
jgi:predicted PurR-regulated permease PerM